MRWGCFVPDQQQHADVLKEANSWRVCIWPSTLIVVVQRFRFHPQATKHALASWHFSRRRAPLGEARTAADVLCSCADAIVSLLRSLCRCICLGSTSPPSHQQISSALLPNTKARILLAACAHSCLDSMSSCRLRFCAVCGMTVFLEPPSVLP